MTTPYTSGPHILEAQGGLESCFEIRAPHRGAIRAIKFEQIDGAPADCEFSVLTKRAACGQLGSPGQIGSSGSSFSSASSESLDESQQGPRSAYSIFGTKTMTAGQAFGEFNVEYPFRNNDGTPTNPVRRLYPVLRPGGSGLKQFALTLEMDTSPLG